MTNSHNLDKCILKYFFLQKKNVKKCNCRLDYLGAGSWKVCRIGLILDGGV